jgi:long-chain acyl-CoA synthetase
VLNDKIDNPEKEEKEIKDYCRKNIVKYAIPYEYEFRQSLPITKVGKIDYKQFEKK